MDMAMRAAGPRSPESSARSYSERCMCYPMLAHGVVDVWEENGAVNSMRRGAVRRRARLGGDDRDGE